MLKNPQPKICIIESCGKEFIPVTGNQITCSKECHDIRSYQTSRKSKQALRTEETIKRDAEYSKKYRAENKEYLDKQKKKYQEEHKEELAAKAKKWREENKEIKAIKDREYREKNREYLSQKRKEYVQSENGKKIIRALRGKRKAMIKGATVGEVDYNEIHTRDNNTCQICKKKIDMSLEYPDQMSKSYDHIIPLSRGGVHSTTNLQLTHLVCNLKKNNNISKGVQMHLL